jgi:AraC-like DNA-binding protein
MGVSAVSAPDRSPSAFVRFCTSDCAPRERLEAWREIYGRTLLKLDIEPIEDAFHTDVRMRKVPGLGMITGSRSATFYRRNRIDNDDLVMSFGLGGGFEAMQFGRTETMRPGEAVVVTAGAPGHVRASSGGRTITLCLPRAAAAHAVSALDAALCRRIPADNAALRLLTHYVGILDQTDMLATDAQRHAVAHVHDLVALTLGATRDGAEAAKARGAGAARLSVIKDDIGKNLAHDLSIGTIAARHRLPVRYVQRLFEADGVTFTEYVLEARLGCVHRMLRDPRLADVKISTVACDAGFGDPSYFNRVFRRRYGAAPSDIRVQAQRGN